MEEEGEDRVRCACKGLRTCTVCESYKEPTSVDSCPVCTIQYLYCDGCKKAWPVSGRVGLERAAVGRANDCSEHRGESVSFPGIHVMEEFVSTEEEEAMCGEIDRRQWVNSQSGRRKQDFGPKVNFKKRKLKPEAFKGLPAYCREVIKRFRESTRLSDFRAVELCNLEYVPRRGSSISPHFDDFWVWGERLITLNLLTSTFLTFTPGCERLEQLFSETSRSAEFSDSSVLTSCVRDENLNKSRTDISSDGDKNFNKSDMDISSDVDKNLNKGETDILSDVDKSVSTTVSNKSGASNVCSTSSQNTVICGCNGYAGDQDTVTCGSCATTSIGCNCCTSDQNTIVCGRNGCVNNQPSVAVTCGSGSTTSVGCNGCTSGRWSVEVLVAMPRRSLLVVYDSARYEWMHSVKRDDVLDRRLAMTFRELTPEFLEGGVNADIGEELLRRAAIDVDL